MSWNHRVLAHKHNEEIHFKIHEVFYNKKRKPNAHTMLPISIRGDNIKDIKWTLKMIKKCLKKPILWHGDKFPEEYK